MSKLALINRNEKRKKLVAKYAKGRVALVAIVEQCGQQMLKRRVFVAALVGEFQRAMQCGL